MQVVIDIALQNSTTRPNVKIEFEARAEKKQRVGGGKKHVLVCPGLHGILCSPGRDRDLFVAA